MEKTKSDGEVLAEIYRNAQLALQSISDIMPEASGDNDLRAQCPGAVGATMKAR